MPKYFSMLLISFALIVMAGCGLLGGDNTDELRKFVPAFEQVSQRVNRPVTVGLLDLEFVDSLDDIQVGAVGYCHIKQGKNPKIQVVKKAWESRNETAREVLMFHELGHCALKRNHFDLTDPVSGSPLSLMNTRGVQDPLYTKHRDYYTYELFWNPVRQVNIAGDGEQKHICF